jgi:hypothetical protein
MGFEAKMTGKMYQGWYHVYLYDMCVTMYITKRKIDAFPVHYHGFPNELIMLDDFTSWAHA